MHTHTHKHTQIRKSILLIVLIIKCKLINSAYQAHKSRPLTSSLGSTHTPLPSHAVLNCLSFFQFFLNISPSLSAREVLPLPPFLPPLGRLGPIFHPMLISIALLGKGVWFLLVTSLKPSLLSCIMFYTFSFCKEFTE
jgi:hypothetical protein